MWDWDLYDDIIGNIRWFENGSDFDGVLNSIVFWELLNDWSDFERQIYILWNSVGHNFEQAIGWNEGNTSVSIESAQPHTLMKLNVINLYTFLLLFTLRSGISFCIFY